MQTRNIKGFTLIELLVVIAIIALLLAILMPSLKAAKKRAQTLVCLSNLKQIGMAANLYANDYDDRIPRGAGGGNDVLWFIEFLPYVGHGKNVSDYKQVDIYKCKSFPRSGTGIGGIPNSRQTVCYVINGWEFDNSSDTTGHSITKSSKVTSFRRRASIAYLTDNESGEWRPVIESEDSADLSRLDIFMPSHLPDSTDETGLTSGRRIAKDRHKDGCNVLFLDWHAESMKAEDITIKNFRYK
ncbi:MAG: prepilin-type N-terminal cleavage/methylation domain-containing protein [Planctomycetes bacterium]|nr:prepilin-type N-terminal cleavage/methylation domain-containing protein [Planctomycetota bacterium]